MKMILRILSALAVTIALQGSGGAAIAANNNRHAGSGGGSLTLKTNKHVVLSSGTQQKTKVCKPAHSHNCHPLENGQ